MSKNKEIAKQMSLIPNEENEETKGRPVNYDKKLLIEQIKKLRLEGMKIYDISKKLDIPERSIYKLLEKKKSSLTNARPIEFEGIKYFNVDDTARLLKVSVVTIRNYIKQKKLSAKKLGRGYVIPENGIKALLPK